METVQLTSERYAEMTGEIVSVGTLYLTTMFPQEHVDNKLY